MNFNKPSFTLPLGVTVPAVSFKASFTLKIGQRVHKHAAPDELAKEPASTNTNQQAEKQNCSQYSIYTDHQQAHKHNCSGKASIKTN